MPKELEEAAIVDGCGQFRIFWRIRFLHTVTGRELLAEKRPYTWYPGPRVHAPRGDGAYRLEQHFEAHEGERIFGLGQHLHGRLDQKGLVTEFETGVCQSNVGKPTATVP
ncbi:hypothetical protein [Streptomyces sp. B21-108]|uniref:hypothetical protein n=1 Tax=Streptomyces sp. B21-108 TaxID=3039419 RepID=UPI002FEFCFEA